MKKNDKFRWLRRTGVSPESIWSSLEDRWIPGEGVCTVISFSRGIVHYTIDGRGPYGVKLSEAITPDDNLHYPVDYAKASPV